MEIFTVGVADFAVHPSKYSAILAKMGPMMKSKKWELVNTRYEQWDLREQTRNNLLCLRLDSLTIKNSQVPPLVKQLNNVDFPNLIDLNLQENLIESVEQISRIRFTKLKKLNLGINNITSIKSLRKCIFPQIQQLNLKQNRIKQSLEQLSELKMLMNHDIWLETFPTQSVQGEDVTWLCKLDSICIQWLFLVAPRVRNVRFLKFVHLDVELRLASHR